MLSGASQSWGHMTPGTLNTTVEWPTTRTSLLFLFSSPSPQGLCLKFWKANKQNTAKSSVAFPFLSFCVFSGVNYLASQQAAFTHVLSCSSYGYSAPLSLLTAYIRWASDNAGNKEEASVPQFHWRASSPWKARWPVAMPSCSRKLRRISAWRQGKALLFGSS